MANAPVETKVTVSSVSAAITSYVMGVILLNTDAFDGLSAPLEALVLAGVTTAVTFVAGYLAKHTPRLNG